MNHLAGTVQQRIAFKPKPKIICAEFLVSVKEVIDSGNLILREKLLGERERERERERNMFFVTTYSHFFRSPTMHTYVEK